MELFTKLLTQTDVEKRLSVPTKSLRHLPFPVGDHFVDLRVTDMTQEVWTFRCSTRRNGHPKPVFSAGWLQFVSAKGLIIDDKVIFYEEDDEATGAQYKIEVKRKILTLMGVDFWVDVEQLHLHVAA